MDETKIEQVEAQTEEVKAVSEAEEQAVEAPAEEVKAEAEAQTEETKAEEVAESEVVAEGCDCGKCDSCKAKKETEDDQSEKKVAVKEEAEAEETTEETDVLESLRNSASEKVADLVMEALASLPIEEGMSEEDAKARKEQVMENGSQLLADVFDVLEEIVNGTTVELTGHQVEVKDFVGTGGKVGMGLPAGINPPCKSEDDESEKKVTIQQYHEGVEEIDYKAKYAESEALMDELVATVENTAVKYSNLVEEYNKVVLELQAYKISEAYSITVDDANELLAEGTFDEVCEALDEAEAELAGEQVIAEGEEEKAEDKEAEKEDAKEEKKEEKKEEEQEKALEEIKEEAEETPEVEGAVISEGAEESEEHSKIRAFSVFASQPIAESKKARKAYSVFAD